MINQTKPLFRQVTLIGVGLMGGSIGMAIKKTGLAKTVIGLSRRHGPLVAALKNKTIDKISHDYKKAVSGSDLVIFCTPVKTIINLFPKIGKHLRRGCIVTDVGSTKVEIAKTAEEKLPASVNFIGSHPIAGSEKSGVFYASADLFQDSLCILTPTEKCHRPSVEKLKNFWTRLGSVARIVTPAEHDEILARISHLPHILAYALVRSIPDHHMAYASKGFRDTTRIAASDPKMWSDICLTNSKNVIKSIDDLVANLASIRKAISSKNISDLNNQFKESKKKRDAIS